jgi:hypothetical protein
MNKYNEFGCNFYNFRNWESWCFYFLYCDLSNIIKNITKDAIINEKGFPNKLNDLTEEDIAILNHWIEWDNPFITEVTHYAFVILQKNITAFNNSYINPKQRIGAYMKLRYCIPEHYFTLDMSLHTVVANI